MPKQEITKEKALEALGKYLVSEFEQIEGPVPGLYHSGWQKDNEVWKFIKTGANNTIGASRVIVISGSTGEVVSDAVVGE